MIITCNNCDKKFNIHESLITERGRLLQCNGCNHKWFFRNEIMKKSIDPVKVNKAIDDVKLFNDDSVPEKNDNSVPEKFESLNNFKKLDKEINDRFLLEKISINSGKIEKNAEINQNIDQSKPKKNLNILKPVIVFIISFGGIIIVLDTFQNPISKIVPNIEIILYNLYETINDIKLFVKDLI